MADAQAHRGPDDRGVVWFDAMRSGLAHRRLSIIDLSAAGHQPMRNARGNRWITFNGEIYNYRELRDQLVSLGHQFSTNSDTEVILAAYDQWGANCVTRLSGMFAFGIYDADSGELFLARDHLGIKPLYYCQQGETFAFASEAKALFEVEGIERRIDPRAVVSALMLLWVPEPVTGFEGVEKLLPGHYAYLRNGRLTVTRYWDVPVRDAGAAERSENDYVEELRELLLRSVRRQMVADVPVGALLSGGLDSSLVVALMRAVHNGPINTYTISFSSRDLAAEAMPDDAKYAAIVARTFGTEHHVIEADPDADRLLPLLLHHLDDPLCDGAAINTYLIASAARANGTVVLMNGMGADEIFGGYRKQLASILVDRYRHIPAWLRGMIGGAVGVLPVSIGSHGLRLSRWAKRFVGGAGRPGLEAFISGFAYFGPEELRALLAPPMNSLSYEELYPIAAYHATARAVAGRPLIDQMTYLDTKLFLPGLNLLYSDKAAMAASVETRPPLIDTEIVEFAARLPGRYKIRGSQQKYLLKRAAESFLPREIIYRRKAAFGTPIRSWMQRDLAGTVREQFSRPSEAVRRFIVPTLPLAMLDEHVAGRKDNAHSLWGLHATATWIDINATPRPAGKKQTADEGHR